MNINGLLDLSLWGHLAMTLLFTHTTIAAVTIYLHRHSAHRSVDLHPIISHFFRFWLWITTGMTTKAWTAIHRKHHAKCETVEDPHSPQILTLKKVLLEGAELYRAEGKDEETLRKYGHGTPNDWLEINVYGIRDRLGISLMLIIDIVLFGLIGITIWAIQMLWIPFFAAGVINGAGHFVGYRNYQTEDASTNLVPFGILIGGEELHNNHHAYSSSAKLSSKWYEFDIGWFYIRTLEMLRLAKVKRLAPKLRLKPVKIECDDETLQAIITHRYDVLARFTKSIKTICSAEIKIMQMKGQNYNLDFRKFRYWLHLENANISRHDQIKLDKTLKNSRILQTIYTMRQELVELWEKSSATKEQLIAQLEDWCNRAEKSGISSLVEFSTTLRSYA